MIEYCLVLCQMLYCQIQPRPIGTQSASTAPSREVYLTDYVLWRCVDPDHRQSHLIAKSDRGKYLLLEKHSLETSDPETEIFLALPSSSMTLENAARWESITNIPRGLRERIPDLITKLLPSSIGDTASRGILGVNRAGTQYSTFTTRLSATNCPYGAEYQIAASKDNREIVSWRSCVALPHTDFSGFLSDPKIIAFCIVRDDKSQIARLVAVSHRGEVETIPHMKPISIAAHPLGSSLALVSDADAESRTLSVTDASLDNIYWTASLRLREEHRNYCPEIIWSDDGRIVSVCTHGSPDVKASLYLYDSMTGRLIAERRMRFDLIRQGAFALTEKEVNIEPIVGIRKLAKIFP